MPTVNGDNNSIAIQLDPLEDINCANVTDYLTFLNFCEYSVERIGDKVPIEYALPLYGYVVPGVILLTLVTNSFIVAVLTKKHLRTPTNTVLLAMAVVELLTGLCTIPWLLYYYTFGGHLVDEQMGIPKFWCENLSLFLETLPTVFHTCAVWLTVFLAIQRYIYVCIPALARRWCTMRRTRYFVCAIAAIPVVMSLPKALATFYSSHSFSVSDSMTKRFCLMEYSEWVKQFGLGRFFLSYFWSIALFSHGIPCVILTVFTGLLIRTIQEAEHRRRVSLYRSAHHSANGSSHVSRMSCGQSFHSTTKMLVVVIFVFLLLEIPAALIYILHTFLMTTNFYSNDTKEFYKVMNISLIFRNVLLLLSYPLNFCIYCGMSHQFRLTVRQLFTRETFTFQRQADLGPGVLHHRYSLVVFERPLIRRTTPATYHCAKGTDTTSL